MRTTKQLPVAAHWMILMPKQNKTTKIQMELEFEPKPQLMTKLPYSVSNKLERSHLVKFEASAPLIRKSILASAVEVITRHHIWPVLQTKPETVIDSNGSRVFKNFNTGLCFHTTYASLNNATAHMVPFALFSDGMCTYVYADVYTDVYAYVYVWCGDQILVCVLILRFNIVNYEDFIMYVRSISILCCLIF
jgi:hypothetical protein